MTPATQPATSTYGHPAFDADESPTATLVSVDMHGTGKDDWVLMVDFTLRGITKRLPLAFFFLGVSPGMGRGEVAGFEGEITAEA